MKSREEHIEFDMNYCQHYQPKPGSVMQDYCALGCGASERMDAGRKAGEPNMTPCIGGHEAKDVLALCPKWIRRTREHAEARADAMEKHMKEFMRAQTLISKVKREHKGRDWRGIEVCPACGGKLHMSHARYNGHVHGKCETEDCLNWME